MMAQYWSWNIKLKWDSFGCLYFYFDIFDDLHSFHDSFLRHGHTHTHTHTLTHAHTYIQTGVHRGSGRFTSCGEGAESLSLFSSQCFGSAPTEGGSDEECMTLSCVWGCWCGEEVYEREMRFDLFILNICFISKIAFRLVRGSQCVWLYKFSIWNEFWGREREKEFVYVWECLRESEREKVCVCVSERVIYICC